MYVVCNFDEFRIHDLNDPTAPPVILKLSELEEKFHALDFMIDSTVEKVTVEEEISFKAGQLVGRLYDELLKCYKNPSSKESLHSLNVLCVRLVFCLYAEDAGIFGRRRMFHDYLTPYRERPKDVRRAVLDLFEVFDTPVEDRDKYLDDELAAFPYVNGSLFANTTEVEVPNFTPEIVNLLLEEASEGFDWSKISPTIFGAVFESTLNPETRRKGGMHYTSIENIHKVIDPLFMDDLNDEFAKICSIKTLNTKHEKLQVFHAKLASLTFLDPACGSGNFLTETYLSLRRLENEIIRIQSHGQASFNVEGLSPTKISLSQFYGIEINDFACAVAKTALWIAESQMLNETEDILGRSLPFFPLKTLTSIVEGNALSIDWNSVIGHERLNYIIGNPPFAGKKEQTKNQKQELQETFENKSGSGNLDYVCAWYKKAANFIQGTSAKVAFVSTNSITQGEQVGILWSLLSTEHPRIIFAYRTFVWNSEALDLAHVHCVIIGFDNGTEPISKRLIFDEDSNAHYASNINGYLVDASDIVIKNRSVALCEDAPKMVYGSMPIDNGHLILETNDEYDVLVNECKEAAVLVRKYGGGQEIINNSFRRCLWLKGASPALIKKSKFVKNRIDKTKEFRASSNRPQTKELANYPALFGEIRQPNSRMLVIPKVSSEKRRYIPMAFVEPEVIINGSALIIADADLYTFGILSSSVHNSWMRTVAGRMKSDYQYSNSVVYNNFVWPLVDAKQKNKIVETAKEILKVRQKFIGCTLADLYDETSMPDELRKAHLDNDKAVLIAYGLKKQVSESDIVEHLMKLYCEKDAEVKKIEVIDVAVQKVLGKKAETVPDWMDDLRKQCLDGKITTDDLIVQGKARFKEEKKKAREAEKMATEAS